MDKWERKSRKIRGSVYKIRHSTNRHQKRENKGGCRTCISNLEAPTMWTMKWMKTGIKEYFRVFVTPERRRFSVSRDQGMGGREVLEIRMAPDLTATLQVRRQWGNAFRIPKNIIPNLKLHTQLNYQSNVMTK